MTAAAAAVIDASDRDFETAVIERSRSVPVVVDFWAPWCGPCRVIGPVLERLASEMQGAFVLVKVNVDESPALSQQFGIRSIPMVSAFRDGQVVDSFTGALPESQIRAWIRKVVPSDADQQVEEAAKLIETDPTAAAERFRAVLERDPANEAALLGLGRALLLQGDDGADEALRRVPRGSKGYAEAQALLQISAFLRIAEGGQQSAGDTGAAGADQHARYIAAARSGRDGNWEAALQQLLQIVQREGIGKEGSLGDQARDVTLAIFEFLGDGDPLVARYRRQLANALF